MSRATRRACCYLTDLLTYHLLACFHEQSHEARLLLLQLFAMAQRMGRRPSVFSHSLVQWMRV